MIRLVSGGAIAMAVTFGVGQLLGAAGILTVCRQCLAASGGRSWKSGPGGLKSQIRGNLRPERRVEWQRVKATDPSSEASTAQSTAKEFSWASIPRETTRRLCPVAHDARDTA